MHPLRAGFLPFLFFAASCAAQTPTSLVPPPTHVTPFETQIQDPTPTATTPFVLLLASEIEDEWRDVISRWAHARDFDLIVRAPQDPGWQESLSRVGLVSVVSVATGEGSTITSALGKDVPWVAVGEAGVNVGSRVSLLSGTLFEVEEVGFLAGLTVGLATRNGRVGILLQPGVREVEGLLGGFLRGLRYICPACRVTEFDPGSLNLTGLRVNAIDTLFVDSRGLPDETLSALRESGIPILILQGSTGMVAGVKVLAEITLDPRELIVGELESLFAGGPGGSPRLSLKNGGIRLEKWADFLSEGRQRILQEVLLKLENGDLDLGLDQSPIDAP